MQITAKVFMLPFLRKERIAENTYCFFFDRKQVAFHYLPGQYIQITLPHNSPDDEGTTRYFTISSSPTEKDYLMITTRVRQSTFKKTLFSLKKGATAQFFGPIGTFVLQDV